MIQQAIGLYSKSVGSGEVVLMIHGIMSDHAIFNRVQRILGKEFKTITYDRRGYGMESDSRYRDYSIKIQAEDAIEVLRQYTNEPVYIIGDSTGGSIAIQIAILYPRLVKGIFLIETTIPCDNLNLSCLHAWQDGVHRIAKTKDIYKIVPLFAKITNAKPVAQKSKLKDIKKTIFNIRNYIYGEMNATIKTTFSYDIIKKITCPIVMGISSEGKNLPFGIGARKTADFFGWRVVYLSGHHNTIQEYPYEFFYQFKTIIKWFIENKVAR